jgi:hypothetical protein
VLLDHGPDSPFGGVSILCEIPSGAFRRCEMRLGSFTHTPHAPDSDRLYDTKEMVPVPVQHACTGNLVNLTPKPETIIPVEEECNFANQSGESTQSLFVANTAKRRTRGAVWDVAVDGVRADGSSTRPVAYIPAGKDPTRVRLNSAYTPSAELKSSTIADHIMSIAFEFNLSRLSVSCPRKTIVPGVNEPNCEAGRPIFVTI